ncbi:MAG: hypothetical protein PHP59_00070 [Methanofollis sp.]|uniref:hypothetical protein n=1 Tax=Methanofollis sp. TaxID=2052835 RepID=UPI0026397E97|nr:hypothetical protein [Methanofollis sp.]MDD4253760.1 hypothetical protein [Methanofollis sp.]
MNNPPAPGAVRYIVVDRESRKTLCITPSYEEACQVWQEEIGYAAEIHAVPALSRVAFVGKQTRIADPEVCHLPWRGVMLPPSAAE